MGVGVIPIGPGAAARHLECVGEGLARRDVEPAVVGAAGRRNVQAVEVEVGDLRQPVRKAKPDGLALAHADQLAGKAAAVGPQRATSAIDHDVGRARVEVDLDQARLRASVWREWNLGQVRRGARPARQQG